MISPHYLKECFPSVAFGTSGVRALVADLSAASVSAYVYAFVQRMRDAYALQDGTLVCVGMDLRPSSPAIAAVVCTTLQAMGYRVEFAGTVPTPALALRCLTQRAPGVMVTGSHIPFDRNGIKFYSPVGEILKPDEQAISSCVIPDAWGADTSQAYALPNVAAAVAQEYVARYRHYFGAGSLNGLRIGVYEHSAVGRDLTKDLLQRLGAVVIALGRSDHFVPVDTEAVNDQDQAMAQAWCAEHALDALVSTDGDGDRPLVFDAQGQFVRGDILGLLCARQLRLQALVVPVSCNTAIEKSACFETVVRTRIGSPYVITAMQELGQQSAMSVGGFEANGGFLLGADLPGMTALPTRDALLPVLAVLSAAVTQQLSLHEMVSQLPSRCTHSDRIQDVPKEHSQVLLERLLNDRAYAPELFGDKGALGEVDTTDGVRLTFADGDVVHIRPSGNAPELRCYVETGDIVSAKKLCSATLARLR